MPAIMTKTLDTIRRDIESVDHQLHDLLMRRAALSAEIGVIKKESGGRFLYPEREAAKIRVLMARHDGDMPVESVVRIWREIISASAMIQTDIRVALYPAGEDAVAVREMIRDYFGSTVPVQETSNVLSALSAVREGEAQFAVLPWPQDEVENPWWSNLDDNLHIVLRLPYVDNRLSAHSDCRVLVVARMPFAASGRDHTFLTLDLDETVSRARVLDKAGALDMNVVGIYSRRPRMAGSRSYHLIEVDSHVAADDPRLESLLDRLESLDGRCAVIGGYPVLSVSRD